LRRRGGGEQLLKKYPCFERSLINHNTHQATIRKGRRKKIEPERWNQNNEGGQKENKDIMKTLMKKTLLGEIGAWRIGFQTGGR
jgi:hypothetical protein